MVLDFRLGPPLDTLQEPNGRWNWSSSMTVFNIKGPSILGMNIV